MGSILADAFTGGSIGAGFSNQSTNTSQNTNQNFSTNGDTNTQRTLTPYQSAIQSPLFSYITQLMTNPSSAIAPFQNQARNNVNNNYAGLGESLRQQFMGTTGGGGSGKFGTALAQGNLKRVGELSDVDNQFAQTAATLPLQASQIASNLLGMNFGQNTTTSQAGTSASASTGTSKTSGFSLKI